MPAIPFTEGGPEESDTYEYHWRGQFLESHTLSDVGKKREHNEDRCILCVPEDAALAEGRGMLFAVADGMGGVRGGAYASRVALDTLTETYYRGTADTVPGRLRGAIDAANRKIYDEAEHQPEYYGMGTTVSTLLVKGDHAYVAQVGDSRVYLLRGDALSQVTDDHSLVAEQLRNGLISEDEAKNHALKNLITRAVGTTEAVKVDLFVFRLKPNDTLLLCSDGLSNVVEDQQIQEALGEGKLQAAARILVGRALEGGGPDNISVLLVRVCDIPPKTAPEEGARHVALEKGGLLGRLKGLMS